MSLLCSRKTSRYLKLICNFRTKPLYRLSQLCQSNRQICSKQTDRNCSVSYSAIFFPFSDLYIWLRCVNTKPVLYSEGNRSKDRKKTGQRDFTSTGESFSNIKCTQWFCAKPYSSICLRNRN